MHLSFSFSGENWVYHFNFKSIVKFSTAIWRNKAKRQGENKTKVEEENFD